MGLVVVFASMCASRGVLDVRSLLAPCGGQLRGDPLCNVQHTTFPFGRSPISPPAHAEDGGLNVHALERKVLTHIGLVPYKSAGKCMVCTCIAAYVFQRVL